MLFILENLFTVLNNTEFDCTIINKKNYHSHYNAVIKTKIK